MCKDGALTGKVCFVDDKILPQIEVMINEHVYIFRGKPNIYTSILFILLFK
ncbi:putative type I restriction enzyme S subunit [Rickettsia massiliae str. AZT80]|uniref:Putative type I restriction enzyme S subunit n=1 Tax=Rickettsia massiliae str. AZT80 TaxID=1105112 RepID=H6QKD3_RICMA|nr:putative type I restriction enzyme S subunit [Rickettsia massiliae str. AZT80]